MPRYFIEVSYKGTHYSGFQIQKNAVTIQSKIEESLFIKFRIPFSLTGASRTDAGVHARQNFFHFDTEKDFFGIGTLHNEKYHDQIIYSLNSILPKDIVIKKIVEVNANLHCRFDAISREYKYYIYSSKNPFCEDVAYFYPYPLNFDKLQQAANIILHTQDFTSFSKKNPQIKNFICSVYKSEWRQKENFLVYNIIANRFLRGMVKAVTATMLMVGTNKISINQFKEIIMEQNRMNANFSAPSHGLFLESVKYTITI